MFRKIVSDLPFSPALIGQLGFYAKRLRKEETTRRLALIFVALALAVQSLVVFQPSTSANAASPNDFVNGGLGQSINNFLSAYDSNTRNLKDVMNYVGITRDEIAATKYTSFSVGERLSWGFVSHFSYSQGERQYDITNSDGQSITTAYSRPLKLWYSSSSNLNGWVGYSKSIGWFALMQECGNLVTETTPPPPPPAKCLLNSQLLATDPSCKPCPGNSTLWVSDKACIPNIIKSKKAVNTSQGFVDASIVSANSGDQINYTITISNTGLSPTSVKLEDNLSDLLDYATLVDNGGGTLDSATGILSWPDITLAPNDIQTRTYVIRILDSIPATAQGSSNLSSYDCVLTNTFGNSININVVCPTQKVVEKVATELPKTGPTANIVFACIILAAAAYFFARSRQLEKEIRLIRKNANTGTIY
jgi:uncharacterized repeat protein (TIGR01451 family)